MYVTHFIHVIYRTPIHTRNCQTCTSILPKPITVRSELGLLLDFVIFNSSTKLKLEEYEETWEVDVKTKNHDKPISYKMNCEGFYQQPQRPKPDWNA